MHQDLIFNTPAGIGGQPDVFVRLKGGDPLDEADGANGDQVVLVPGLGVVFFGEAEGRIFPVKNDPIRAAEFQMDVQVYFFLGTALFDHDVVQYGGDQG